jgi:hypothetical protein
MTSSPRTPFSSTACDSDPATTTTSWDARSTSTRELKQEGRLGFWRWTSIFLGIAGTYRADDWVDIVYELNGEKAVKTRLPVAA